MRERQDRAFATGSWWQLFPLCKLSVYHAICSDHDPIVLDICNVNISKKQFRFKFENIWLREHGFHTEIKKYWEHLPRIHLLPKLLSLSAFMSKWGRNFFHKFRDRICYQKEVLNNLVNRTDEEGIRNYFLERDRLNDLFLQEEVYWKQRAKCFWLAEGDSNSKYFHAFASARKKSNLVSGLRTDEGLVVTEKEEMHKVVIDYFRTVFTERKHRVEMELDGDERCITDNQNDELVADLSFKEFTVAVKQMHPDKASGPDGLNPAFFQNFWPTLGREVFVCCKEWLDQCMCP